jgi:acetyl esterase/lipase
MRWTLHLAALIAIVGLIAAGLQSANSAPGPPVLSPIQRNITYCTVNAIQLKMDFYYPQMTTARSAPVAVYVHGGGWSAGDKADGDAITDIPELTSGGWSDP